MFGRITRDTVIVGFSVTMGAYEIVIGGGRASVLTFLSGLLLAPVALHIDEARRQRRNGNSDRHER